MKKCCHELVVETIYNREWVTLRCRRCKKTIRRKMNEKLFQKQIIV